MLYTSHWGHGSEENRQNLCPCGTYIQVGRQKINKKNKVCWQKMLGRKRQAGGIGSAEGSYANLDKANREGVPEKVT